MRRARLALGQIILDKARMRQVVLVVGQRNVHVDLRRVDVLLDERAFVRVLVRGQVLLRLERRRRRVGQAALQPVEHGDRTRLLTFVHDVRHGFAEAEAAHVLVLLAAGA